MSQNEKLQAKKFANKNESGGEYGGGEFDDDVFGAGEGTAGSILNMFSDAASKGGGILSEIQAKKDAAAKTAADVGATKEQLTERAAAARKTASMLAADAITEPDYNGPKHQAAAAADIQARAAEAKAAVANGQPMPGAGPMMPYGMSPKKDEIFTGRNIAIGLGGLAALVVAIKLIRR